jgi:hypothetical protein
MCEVYENAFLTFCANSSPDCEMGMSKYSTNSGKLFHGITAAGNPYSCIAIAEGSSTFPLQI